MGCDPRNKTINVGDCLHGYEVLRQTEVPNLALVASELRHGKTGAHHLHLSHEMQENVFITALRTIPGDDTGVAHILEHSVLEGSKNFPVKMFDLMTGRSLNSFLNAFTAADKTAYPFATPNEDDWHNLLERYLDAMFHPLLEDEVFLQEGWRHEFNIPDDPTSGLTLRGVVFNEMKATMSSPDGQFSRGFLQALFPDICLQFNSGGDPKAIPDLTIENWRAFHKRHYHPGNSWTVTFGSFPLAPTLEKIDHSIGSFDAADSVPIGLQPVWDKAKTVRKTYAVQNGTPPEAAPITAAMGWRLCEQKDLKDILDLTFLMEVLCGSLTAPLNHSLLQSGLAPSLAPTGFDGFSSQFFFGIGLKGIDENRIDDFVDLLMKQLEILAAEGLPEAQIKSVLDRFDLEMREQKRVWGMPWGLGLAYFGFPRWMEGEDPSEQLRHDLLLKGLHERLENPQFLQNLIRHWFLENTNRLLFIMTPEQGGIEKQEADAREILSKVEASLSEADQKRLITESEAVRDFREREQDLSCMPVIEVDRLSRKAFQCDLNIHKHTSLTSLELQQPTNGILHVNGVFPLDVDHPDSAIVDLLAWLPSLSHAGLGVVGSERRIQSLTSGISMGSYHSLPMQGLVPKHSFRISFHGLLSRRQELLSLFEDLLFRAEFSDETRLSELLKMRQTNLRSRVVNGASTIALDAALAEVSPLMKRIEEIEGLPFLRRLATLDVKKDSLSERLGSLYRNLLEQPERFIATCSDAELDAVRGHLTGFPFQNVEGTEVVPLAALPLEAQDELRYYSTEVDGAHVAQVFEAPSYTHPDAPLLTLLANCLHQPLHDRIRAKGGAYGARAAYSFGFHAFYFLSWCDPRVAGTLADYAVCRKLACKGFTQDEVDRAKIEAIRQMETPLLPHEKGKLCVSNFLRGATQELRDQFRQRLLDATSKDLTKVAEMWLGDQRASRVAVVGSASMSQGSVVDGLSVRHEELLPLGNESV